MTGEVFQQMCFPLCVHHRTSSHADSAVIWRVLEVADGSLWVKAEALNLRSNLESVLS